MSVFARGTTRPARRFWPSLRLRTEAASPLRGLIPLGLLLLVWQLVGDESSFSFPPPSVWFTALGDAYGAGLLMPALVSTLETLVISLAVALTLGVLGGMVIGASYRVDRALTPIMDFFRTLPPPATVPLAALLLGATLTMRVSIVVIASVWPILLNTVAAMRALPTVRLEMALTLGLSRPARLRKVVLPSLLPAILLGLRISVSIALIVTLLVEIIGSGEGIGRLLIVRQQRFDAGAVWGLLLIVGTFGYLLNLSLVMAQNRLLRNWPGGSR